ncbi:hypothetical protein [Desulfospira joergensenii]|uniref:hypothetical protein n=1 Tax=Desulfospira joergensenii TaxID=53329 RepID=UPI0003B3C4EC|nr:hypothetical protein [Desulfospira joergensenii]
MRYPDYIEGKFSFPDFFRVRLTPPANLLRDPVREVEKQLMPALDRVRVCPGQTVALGVGSRGIANISEFISCICKCIRKKGAVPWIIPSMGSHGSATPRGQVRVLEKLGICPEECKARIHPEMDVKEISRILGDVPVLFSSKALEADHSICINRIKPHTKFKGPMESGLYKMMVVGMGKHQGALVYHNMALKYGFFDLLKKMGDEIVARSNLCLGIGIVEDQLDRTLAVEVVPAREIAQKEPLLLEKAKAHFPGLPFQDIDILVIQQIGKEISGAGMDPNVTGRTYDFMEDDFSKSLKARRVTILGLSAGTAGNAIGLGNADIITEKVFQEMDYEATLMNALTSMSLRKAFIPVRLPTEEKAVQASFQTIGPVDPDHVRAVIIKDTMHTMDFLVSRALIKEAEAIPQARIGNKNRLEFTPAGDLNPVF